MAANLWLHHGIHPTRPLGHPARRLITRASSGWFRALRTCFPGFRARVFRGGVTKLQSFGTCDNGFFAAPGRRLYVLEGVRDGAYSTLQASSAAVLSPTPENGRAPTAAPAGPTTAKATCRTRISMMTVTLPWLPRSQLLSLPPGPGPSPPSRHEPRSHARPPLSSHRCVCPRCSSITAS